MSDVMDTSSDVIAESISDGNGGNATDVDPGAENPSVRKDSPSVGFKFPCGKA